MSRTGGSSTSSTRAMATRKCLDNSGGGDGGLDSPVEQIVDLEVVIVLPERVVERLGHTQPAEVEEELDGHEDWVVEVRLRRRVSMIIN